MQWSEEKCLHLGKSSYSKSRLNTEVAQHVWKMGRQLASQPKRPSTEEQINKMWCIHTMVYHSAIKSTDQYFIPFYGWTSKTY